MQGSPILGVQVFLTSGDVLEVDCPQGFDTPPGETKALCQAVSDAQGVFTFKSVPCGNASFMFVSVEMTNVKKRLLYCLFTSITGRKLWACTLLQG